MSQADCLFCKIVDKKIPAAIVHENEHVLAFRDIHPAAPTHVLVIPKAHIVGMHELTRADIATVGEVFLAARDVAEKLGLPPSGYRVVVNNGPDAGQSVFHLHVHVIGGRPLPWPPFAS
jgi:histidine triad (HIT) family protein